jgi:hypothetical protein
MRPAFPLHEVKRSLRASPGFSLTVLITLGLAGLIGLMTFLMFLLGGFLGMAHFTEPQHRIHDLTYGLLFGTAVVGLLLQLRPSRNVAGMLMALTPWVGLLLGAILSTDPGVIRSAERILVAAGTVIAVVLFPRRRDLLRSFSVFRANWVMLGMVIAAALPLLAFAATNIGRQGSFANEHAVMGHYGFMAAFGFTVIAVGLVASLRPEGWRAPAWVAGLLSALLGLASVVYPGIDSSLDSGWALAAIGWGVLFVATATLTPQPERSSRSSAVVRDSGQPGGTEEMQMAELPSSPKVGMPRWVKVSGIIVGVLVLLAVILVLTGVLGGQHGPARHIPGGGGSDTPLPGVTGDAGHSPPPGIRGHGQ